MVVTTMTTTKDTIEATTRAQASLTMGDAQDISRETTNSSSQRRIVDPTIQTSRQPRIKAPIKILTKVRDTSLTINNVISSNMLNTATRAIKVATRLLQRQTWPISTLITAWSTSITHLYHSPSTGTIRCLTRPDTEEHRSILHFAAENINELIELKLD